MFYIYDNKFTKPCLDRRLINFFGSRIGRFDKRNLQFLEAINRQSDNRNARGYLQRICSSDFRQEYPDFLLQGPSSYISPPCALRLGDKLLAFEDYKWRNPEVTFYRTNR